MTTKSTIARSQIIDAISALQLPDGPGLIEVRIFQTDSVNVFRTVGPVETYDAVDDPRPVAALSTASNHPAVVGEDLGYFLGATPNVDLRTVRLIPNEDGTVGIAGRVGPAECPTCHAVGDQPHTEYCKLGDQLPAHPAEEADHVDLISHLGGALAAAHQRRRLENVTADIDLTLRSGYCSGTACSFDHEPCHIAKLPTSGGHQPHDYRDGQVRFHCKGNNQ